MAGQHRVITADSRDKARAAAQQLLHRDYVLVSDAPDEIVVRRPHRRGDEIVVIQVVRPTGSGPPPPPPPPPPGAPRSEDGRWWWDGTRWNPCSG